MFSFPPLPPWNGLHPLVVHFPIALIMIAPLFVLLALLIKQRTRELIGVSALLMILAAGGALLATSTGSAAEALAEKFPGAKAILHEHEELGESAEIFAIALAAALIVGFASLCIWRQKLSRGIVLGLGVVYLIAHAAGMLVVANAAHQGGRLVHEVGVRANMSPAAGGPVAAPTSDHRNSTACGDTPARENI
jgi:uncharacterized membrane protein